MRFDLMFEIENLKNVMEEFIQHLIDEYGIEEWFNSNRDDDVDANNLFVEWIKLRYLYNVYTKDARVHRICSAIDKAATVSDEEIYNVTKQKRFSDYLSRKMKILDNIYIIMEKMINVRNKLKMLGKNFISQCIASKIRSINTSRKNAIQKIVSVDSFTPITTCIGETLIGGSGTKYKNKTARQQQANNNKKKRTCIRFRTFRMKKKSSKKGSRIKWKNYTRK